MFELIKKLGYVYTMRDFTHSDFKDSRLIIEAKSYEHSLMAVHSTNLYYNTADDHTPFIPQLLRSV